MSHILFTLPCLWCNTNIIENLVKSSEAKNLRYDFEKEFASMFLTCYCKLLYTKKIEREAFFFGDLEIWKTNRTFWKKATFNIIKNLVKSLEHGISIPTSKRLWPHCYSRAIVSYCIPKRSSVRPSFLTRIFFGIPHFTLVDLISLETWNLEIYIFVTNVKSFVQAKY